MLNIDGLAYNNRLRHIHGGEKALFALLTMWMGLIFSSVILSGLIIIVMSFLLVRRAGIPGRVYLKLMSLPFSFLFLSIIAILVSFSFQEQDMNWLLHFRLFGLSVGITDAGWHMAAPLFFKSLGAVSCLYFLSLTTPVVEITASMRKLKLPPLFIELMELIYRFIFVMLKTAEEIYTSQSSRWGYSSLRNSMASLGKLIAALFIRSLNRSQHLFTALSARGYTGQLNVLMPEASMSVVNITFIIIFELCLAAIGLFVRGM